MVEHRFAVGQLVEIDDPHPQHAGWIWEVVELGHMAGHHHIGPARFAKHNGRKVRRGDADYVETDEPPVTEPVPVYVLRAVTGPRGSMYRVEERYAVEGPASKAAAAGRKPATTE